MKTSHSSLDHLGYKIFNYGQKGFHGVAILSKLEPLKIVKGLDGGEDEQQKDLSNVILVQMLELFPYVTRIFHRGKIENMNKNSLTKRGI